MGNSLWDEVARSQPDGVVILDAAGALVDLNPACASLLGRSLAEVVALGPAMPWWPSDQVAALREACARARTSGRASADLVVADAAGERVPVRVELATSAGQGREGWLVLTLRAKDDRELAVSELVRAAERWRSIAENPFDFVVVIDRDHRYQYVNHTAPGISAADLIGKLGPFDFTDPKDHAVMRAAFARVFAEGRPQAYDVHVPQLDAWYATIVGPIFEAGEVVALSLLTRDITSGMRAIAAVRQNEHRLELATQGGEVGIFEIELPSNRSYYSPRVHQMLGLPAGDESLNGGVDGFGARVHPDDLERVVAAWEQAAATGEPFDQTYRVRAASGEDLWFRSRGRTIADGDGTRFSGFLSDVTAQVRADAEHRALEERVRHVARLETLGTVASGIAHEFNNLLVPILSNAEVAQRRLPPGAGERVLLEEVIQAARRARELIARMLVFSRAGDGRGQGGELAAVAAEAARLVKATLPRGIELRCRFDPLAPRLEVDDGQLHQALVNLCTNARQALGERAGTIELVIDAVDLPAARAAQLGLAAGPAVRLVVADDGPGIAAEVVERIFDPFFTTKPVGEGTGLGLWIVHRVVQAHGGAVTVDTGPGRGTRFELWFPARPTAPATAAVAGAPGGVAVAGIARARRILVVDDEALIRGATHRTLVAAGHEVTAVDSAERALELFARGERFDLVLTDQSMPGLSGLELATRLQASQPGVAVIIVTGLAHVGAAHPANVVRVLAKPWSIDELERAVAEA